MKKRNKVIITIAVIFILLLGIGMWFVVDKLNRIDYNDSADTSVGENISTEKPTPEDTVDWLEEPEEEEEICMRWILRRMRRY